uniref:EKC/KEOPS complex subunit Tprkb n=2 Tax=Cacopsylla melanoneura TaxID=428564 RepID=A0A8D8ZLH1_9HEMI
MIDCNIYKLPLENKAYTVYQVLLSNVTNTKQLHKLILAGQLKCCLIKPSLIFDPWIVSVAANKAVESELNATMTTKSIYTEILYNLSSSKNISDSLKQFGVQDSDCEVLAVLVTKDGSVEDITNIVKLIEGSVVPIQNLKDLCDEKLVCKLHSINEKELKVSDLLHSVLSHMSYKEFK